MILILPFTVPYNISNVHIYTSCLTKRHYHGVFDNVSNISEFDRTINLSYDLIFILLRFGLRILMVRVKEYEGVKYPVVLRFSGCTCRSYCFIRINS